MSLQRKLLIAFFGLAASSLILAGLTFFTINAWRNADKTTNEHYQRSLLLQRVRAATFRAFKEVPDAVTGDDPDSRQEFDAYLRPARRDFDEWARLAVTQDEKKQVTEIRAAFAVLVQDAERVFRLVESGRRREAAILMEGQLEDQDFTRFDVVSSRAVASDRAIRQGVRAGTQNAQNTARLVILGAAIWTLVLSLLLAAYLSSDLFSPLKDVERALDDVGKGERDARLSEERDDEIGHINAAFNRMTESLTRREKMLTLGSLSESSDGNGSGDSWQDEPSRLTLHTMITQLRGRVAQLRDGSGETATLEAPALLGQIDGLLGAIARFSHFGFPLDLNLAKTDVKGLLYEVLLRFHDEFARRGVSLELSCAPEVETAYLDRLKIREALGECIQNALNALPERGGKIGLRARLEQHAQGNDLVLEIADDGAGSEESAIDRALEESRTGEPKLPSMGLRLTRAIVEAHGGDLNVQSEPEKGTYVRFSLPLRV